MTRRRKGLAIALAAVAVGAVLLGPGVVWRLRMKGVVERLFGEDKVAAAKAAEELGRHPDTGTVKFMLEWAAKRNPGPLKPALEAMGRPGIESLRSIALRRGSGLLPGGAARQLGLPDKQDVRTEAVSVLSWLGADGAAALADVVISGDSGIAGHAARAMCRVRGPGTVSVLEKAASMHADIQRGAVAALDAIGTEEAVAALERLRAAGPVALSARAALALAMRAQGAREDGTAVIRARERRR